MDRITHQSPRQRSVGASEANRGGGLGGDATARALGAAAWLGKGGEVRRATAGGAKHDDVHKRRG
jgi:hypothetical protein